MSLEFNRRSFLKYSALAAVAVAGSSLLTGCDTEYAVTLKKFGTINNMNVKATLDSAAYDATDNKLAFHLTLENNHTTPLYPTGNSFTINIEYKDDDNKTQTKVYSSASQESYKLTKSLLGNDGSIGIAKDKSASGYIYLENVPDLSKATKITVLYHCDSAFNKFADVWELTYSGSNFPNKTITISNDDTITVTTPTSGGSDT